jgi:hypothetical protein
MSSSLKKKTKVTLQLFPEQNLIGVIIEVSILRFDTIQMDKDTNLYFVSMISNRTMYHVSLYSVSYRVSCIVSNCLKYTKLF